MNPCPDKCTCFQCTHKIIVNIHAQTEPLFPSIPTPDAVEIDLTDKRDYQFKFVHKSYPEKKMSVKVGGTKEDYIYPFLMLPTAKGYNNPGLLQDWLRVYSGEESK